MSPSRVVLWLVTVALCGCAGAPAPLERQVDVAAHATLACPSDAVAVCPAGCCPSGAACGDSGCDLSPIAPSCPVDAPTYCDSPLRAVDSSGNGDDLTLTAPADFVPGRFAGGVGDYCTANTSCASAIQGPAHAFPAGDAPITVEAWVRVDDVDGAVAILSYRGDGGGERVLAMNRRSVSGAGVLADLLWFGDPVDFGPVAGAPMLPPGWHFVAVTCASAQVHFYLDGTEAPGASSLVGARILGTPSAVFVGHFPSGGGFTGGLDELRVLDFAATAGQIAADFRGGPMTAIAGTAALWHFDDLRSGWCCPTGATCGDVAGDCLAPTVGAAACPSSAPVRCGAGCCPPGSTCDASGSCNVAVPGCPSSAPVDCGDGSCCRAGYTCSSGACVLDPPRQPVAVVCPAGTAAATNSTSFCCPSTTPATYSSGHCNGGGCTWGKNGQASALCVAGYTCNAPSPGTSGACLVAAVASTCVTPCNGGCCGSGEVCEGAAGCCPTGTSLCGGACCTTSQCSAGTCSTTKAQASCPSDTTPCGGNCCPSGAVCMSGVCIAVPVPAVLCTKGIACGGQCCAGVSCSATGACLQLAAKPFNPCRSDCYAGSAHKGAVVCHCPARTLAAAANACSSSQFPVLCGSDCCATGGACDMGRCNCPTDHPVTCADKCCLAGAACSAGSCACPPANAPCGTLCCPVGQQCIAGTCASASSGGGGSNCYSTGACIPSVLSKSCECGGSASESQCVSGHPACSAAGGPCNDNVHACCVGETCIDSTCVNGCGQCAGIGCTP